MLIFYFNYSQIFDGHPSFGSKSNATFVHILFYIFFWYNYTILLVVFCYNVAGTKFSRQLILVDIFVDYIIWVLYCQLKKILVVKFLFTYLRSLYRLPSRLIYFNGCIYNYVVSKLDEQWIIPNSKGFDPFKQMVILW
jgi:hypothetical protein